LAREGSGVARKVVYTTLAMLVETGCLHPNVRWARCRGRLYLHACRQCQAVAVL